MLYRFLVLFLGIVLLAGAATEQAASDPAFEGVSFDQWLNEPPNPHFHWKVHPPHATLSFHQRLEIPVEIEMDGRDLEGRRTHGSMLFLVQITDHQGRRYQHHYDLDLSKSDDSVGNTILKVTERAFILPGDYQLGVAAFDSTTKEHCATKLPLRIATVQEPLPGLWRSLPPVEFIRDDDEKPPDVWYLPNIEGRVEWAASIDKPQRLNVVLNVDTLSEEPARHGESANSGLPGLLPTFKLLTETGSPQVSEDVDVIDLSRRRAAFAQKDVKELDWPGLKAALAEANTASIDVHSLAERHERAQFFVSEVRRVLRATEGPSVLVVLSKPVTFESGEDRTPISLEALPPCKLFYIRFNRPIGERRFMNPEPRGAVRPSWRGDRRTHDQFAHLQMDQLEGTLKPLHPKVFDVSTPEEMAKALREVRNALVDRH